MKRSKRLTKRQRQVARNRERMDRIGKLPLPNRIAAMENLAMYVGAAAHKGT